MHLPNDFLSSTHGRSFVESFSAPRLAALHRAAKLPTRQARKLRQAQYKRQLFLNSLSSDARDFYRDNNEARGLPRSYSIRFVDPRIDADHEVLAKLNSSRLILGRYGEKTSLHIDGHNVDDDDVHFAPGPQVLTFQKHIEATGNAAATHLAGYFNFATPTPTGCLSVGAQAFNIELDPIVQWYDVQVYTAAGAYMSTGVNAGLVYDKDKIAAAKPDDTALLFGWDVKNVGDDLQQSFVAQNHFIDTSTEEGTTFELLATGDASADGYTCTVGASDDKGARLLTTITKDIPKAPTSRANLSVKTVFPKLWDVQMTPFADSFYGAFQASDDTVYAVSGTARLPEVSLVALVSRPHHAPPIRNIYSFLDGRTDEHPDGQTVLRSTLELNTKTALLAEATESHPSTGGLSIRTAAVSPLKIFGILGMDPTIPDSKDPSGYSDSCASAAMQDFHDLIVYFMDDDLRQTFVSITQITLQPYLLAIANGDVSKNSAFYKTLQVPYITSMLAKGTLSEAQYCNGSRADKRLKSIPVDNDPDGVYKSHSSQLYRYHFLQKFPAMQTYLNDQSQNDYTTEIDKFVDHMQKSLKKKAEVAKEGNDKYQEQLDAAVEEIKALGQWAKDTRRFWALQLLYWVQASSLPTWYAQYTSGGSVSLLTMNLKKLNGLFGVLEDNAVNTKPGGRNFMQAFNEDVRLFQMGSIVPQMIDVDSNSSEIDDLMLACLAEYIAKFTVSPDKAHQDAVTAATNLYNDAELRRKFLAPFAVASRLSGAIGAWLTITTLWEQTVRSSAWFSTLKNGASLLKVFAFTFCASIIVMGFIPSLRDHMNATQKTAWAVATASLFAMIIVRVAQGALRLYYFFSDISGFWNSAKVLLGFETVIDEIPNSAIKVYTRSLAMNETDTKQIENSFMSFFTRTSKQTIELAERDAGWAALDAEYAAGFSRTSRIFGRNMGEVLGTTLGLALAIVSLVLTSIDISKEHNPLMKAMQAMMIISSAIQILAIVSGMIIAAAGAAAAAATGALGVAFSVLGLCATWGGPVAIAFAIVGIIIFLIWLSLQDTRNPVQKFVDDKAKPAGLWMPGDCQAPDYFELIPAQGNQPSLTGLSFHGPVMSLVDYEISPASGSGSNRRPARRGYITVDSGQQSYLKLSTDQSSIVTEGTLDFSLNMVWSLTTDSDGKSTIYTAHDVTDSAGAVVRTLYYLATNDDLSSLVARTLPARDQTDERAKVLPHCQWTIDIVTAPTISTSGTNNAKSILSAQASIHQGTKYFGRWYDRAAGKLEDAINLVDYNNASQGDNGAKLLCTSFMMSMQPLKPGDFTYGCPTWSLTTKDKDQRNYPRFSSSGVTSQGLKWTISPALDSTDFAFITSAGGDEGMIEQVAGVTPKIMSATEYTIECWLDSLPGSKRTAKVTISVVDGTTIATS